MKKTALTLAALALTASVAAPASAAGHRPDTQCMQAGIAFLKENNLFTTVAQGGLPIDLAVGAGVTVREGKEQDFEAVPNPIPLSVVLADHRAGDDSIFLYPWC